MAQKVSEHLGGFDPFKLRFSQVNAQTGAPKNIVKRSANQSVSDMLQGSSTYNTMQAISTLYYEKLDVSIVELETKKSLRVTWTGAFNKDEVRMDF